MYNKFVWISKWVKSGHVCLCLCVGNLCKKLGDAGGEPGRLKKTMFVPNSAVLLQYLFFSFSPLTSGKLSASVFVAEGRSLLSRDSAKLHQ